jgi:hypothetical protein
VNYPDLPITAARFFSTDYCGLPDCLERNYRGLNTEQPPETPFNIQVRRVISLFHDAFDRPDDLWRLDRSVVPNGDAWLFPGPPVVGIPALGMGYEFDIDDNVALSGAGLRDWMPNSIPECVSEGGLAEECSMTDTSGQNGLARTMFQQGVTWCDACGVFALHVTPTSGTLPRPQWLACTRAPLNDILGPPPQADLRMDATTCTACPERSIAEDDGTCRACPDGTVRAGNTCQPCPAGTIQLAGENQCTACPEDHVSVGNLCFACQPWEGVNLAINACVECPADRIIDCSVGASCVGFQTVSTLEPGPPGDACPDEFWLEVRSMTTLFPDPDGAFVVSAPAALPPNEAQCEAAQSSFDIFFPATPAPWAFDQTRVSSGAWQVLGGCSFTRETVVSGPAIATGADRYRLVVPTLPARNLELSFRNPGAD